MSIRFIKRRALWIRPIGNHRVKTKNLLKAENHNESENEAKNEAKNEFNKIANLFKLQIGRLRKAKLFLITEHDK